MSQGFITKMIAILESRRASLMSRYLWMNNILADVIVGMAALLPAISFVIASWVKSKQGIYAANVTGGLTSLFGRFTSSCAIARTATNNLSGANSLLPSLVHNLQGVHLL